MSASPLTSLELDHSCCNFLNWRCDLNTRPAVEPWGEALQELGYRWRCRAAGLNLWRHRDGHEVVWVVYTGRIQIRVDLGLAEELREAAARSVFADLQASLGERSAQTSRPLELVACREGEIR